jgi:hypothetical protein
MFVFGGNNLTDTFSDFWKIDLKPIVEYHRATSINSALSSSSSSPFATDVVLPDSIAWTEILSEATDTEAPSARIGHTMTAVGSRYFVLYGGRNYLGGTMAQGPSPHFSLSSSSHSPRRLPLPRPFQPMD